MALDKSEVSASAIKEGKERSVFHHFVVSSQLPIEIDSIESRRPPEPDILCVHQNEGKIAFELAELCSEELAQLPSKTRPSGVSFTWASDPTEKILDRKLRKNYKSDFPIELLLYTDGRIVTPDDVILSIIGDVQVPSHCSFRRIWVYGEECHIVWERTPVSSAKT